MNNELEAGDSSSDESYESSDDGSESEIDEMHQNEQQQLLPPLLTPIVPAINAALIPAKLQLPFNWKNNNSFLEQQMQELLLSNQKYNLNF